MTSSVDVYRQLGAALALLNSNQDPQQSPLTAVRAVAQALDAQWAALYQPGQDGDVTPAAVYPEAARPQASELAARALAAGEAQTATGADGLTRAIPLRAGDVSLGVLAVHGRDWPVADEERESALSVLSTLLALYIENRRLRATAAGLWQERNDFVSLVSHEFKTPLTAIKGYAQLARRRLGPQAEASVIRSLSTIDLQADRLAAMASDMVLYTRLGAGLVEQDLGQVDLVRMVSEAVAVAQAGTERTEFALDAAVPSLPIRADRAHVARALINVLSGAARRSPAESQVTVGLLRQGDEALVWVRDRGVTLTAEQRGAVFARIYQHDSGPFGAAELLGLALAKAICEAHGGRLWLESDERHPGTTVFLSLPLSAAGE